VAADGSHGLVISESDDVEGAYRNLLSYTDWIEYDTKVMLTVSRPCRTSWPRSLDLGTLPVASATPQPAPCCVGANRSLR
jgi:hypothetical protein